MTMLDMANDSGLFRTAKELQTTVGHWTATRSARATARYLPLYEAKMVCQYDHRFGGLMGEAT